VDKSGETKLFLGILVVAFLLVGFALAPMLFPGKRVRVRPIAPSSIQKSDLLPPGTRYRGNAKAPYVLVEFGDYQCPSCATSIADVDKMMKKYAAKLRYVFNYSSLVPVQKHPHSEIMAMAAEAAAKQGKYWEMHRALFAEQSKFEDVNQDQALAEIFRTARMIGVNVSALKTEMDSPEIEATIDRQKAIGVNARLYTTPSFFLVKPDGEIEPLGGLAAARSWFQYPRVLL
jgi:protein-disulfide isomerase